MIVPQPEHPAAVGHKMTYHPGCAFDRILSSPYCLIWQFGEERQVKWLNDEDARVACDSFRLRWPGPAEEVVGVDFKARAAGD